MADTPATVDPAADEATPKTTAADEATATTITADKATPKTTAVDEATATTITADEATPKTAAAEKTAKTITADEATPKTAAADEVTPETTAADEVTTTADEDVAAASKDKPADEWVKVLGNDSIKKKTIKKGTGENLEKGQQIRMRYTMMLSSGKIVEENVEQTFQLGDGEVIDAIDLAANLATVGEQFEVLTQSRFGYGVVGCPPHIGSNCSLLIIIEILQAEDTPKISDMTESERTKIGDRKRKIGNENFGRNDFERASKNYSLACKYLDPPSYAVQEEASDELKDLQAKSWCNLALSELKLEKFTSGIQAADRALEIDPKSTKALYRKGKLLEQKGDLQEAEKALRLAVKLEPNSQGCKQYLKELCKKIANEKKKEQKLYKKMFNLEEEEIKNVSSIEKETSWSEGAIPMIAGAVAIGALAVAAYNGFKSFHG